MIHMYDIIGDIHGHAAELKALLEKLGYREQDGAYRHPDRRAVFLGDFIDLCSHLLFSQADRPGTPTPRILPGSIYSLSIQPCVSEQAAAENGVRITPQTSAS